jgi:DNA-binding NarL/FixJ family response regulator
MAAAGSPAALEEAVAISIVLADDHPLLRLGLQTLLEREPDYSIAGAAADGMEAVSLTERLKPDLALEEVLAS